ncbi:hypothetical protein ACIA5G_15170 [Amycolatopsis sp. NPDC051758]|uniref:hypothetical protein n=1 Tax=Amycolatopsis sp. NPDC051758 TaxID=3363935 RepID=UPI0037B4ECCD
MRRIRGAILRTFVRGTGRCERALASAAGHRRATFDRVVVFGGAPFAGRRVGEVQLVNALLNRSCNRDRTRHSFGLAGIKCHATVSASKKAICRLLKLFLLTWRVPMRFRDDRARNYSDRPSEADRSVSLPDRVASLLADRDAGDRLYRLARLLVLGVVLVGAMASAVLIVHPEVVTALIRSK